MTFCRILKEETTPSGKTISAYENVEKYETVPTYEIYVSQNAYVIDVIHTARTTWKKAFTRAYNENR